MLYYSGIYRFFWCYRKKTDNEQRPMKKFVVDDIQMIIDEFLLDGPITSFSLYWATSLSINPFRPATIPWNLLQFTILLNIGYALESDLLPTHVAYVIFSNRRNKRDEAPNPKYPKNHKSQKTENQETSSKQCRDRASRYFFSILPFPHISRNAFENLLRKTIINLQ